MRALKLTLISRRFPPLIGGAEAMLRYLAVGLANAGAEVTVLTSRVDPGLPEHEHPETSTGSLQVYRLPTHTARFLGTLRYMAALRTWLRRHVPDLAYVSMLKHDAYVTVGAGRRHGFPVVLRPEGAGATGDIAWHGWGRFGRTIARRCRAADGFVAISKPIHEELVAAGFDPARIHDLPNGVPVPRQPWNRREHWRDTPHAVYVGRLAAEKGLPHLIRAWPRVRAAYPGARLTLAGEGPERRALEQLIGTMGLAGSVTMPGSVSDVEGLLREADLFVLPSLEEGMSVALLEAMALGIPVVASSIPGNRRLVVDRKHGLLAPAGRDDALANAVLEQWSQFDRAIHWGRAARSLVTQKYSVECVARAHIELFERLIEVRRSRTNRGSDFSAGT